jgi:hypothetical protein
MSGVLLLPSKLTYEQIMTAVGGFRAPSSGSNQKIRSGTGRLDATDNETGELLPWRRMSPFER